MVDPKYDMKKAGTGGSAIWILAIIVLAVAAVGLIVYLFINIEGLLENALILALVIIGVIILIAVAIAIFKLLIIVPMYVAKGEQYQEGVDYSMDDIKPVKESSSEDKQNE